MSDKFKLWITTESPESFEKADTECQRIYDLWYSTSRLHAVVIQSRLVHSGSASGQNCRSQTQIHYELYGDEDAPPPPEREVSIRVFDVGSGPELEFGYTK